MSNENRDGGSQSREIKPYAPGALSTEQIRFEEFTPPEEAHLREYLTVILRRKRVVILFFISVVAAATLVSLVMRPLYRATAVVQIEKETPNIYTFKGVQESSPAYEFDDAYYQTQYKILKSRSLARMTIDRLGLCNNPIFNPDVQKGSFFASVKSSITGLLPFLGGRSDGGDQPSGRTGKAKYRGLINKFIGMVDVRPVQKTQLVKVSFISPSPALAQRTANALARNYVDFNIDERLNASRQAKTVLEKQINILKAKLNASETALNDYAEKNHMLVVNEKDDKEDLLVGQLASTSAALNSSLASRIKAQAMAGVIRRSGALDPLVLNDPVIIGLEQAFGKLDAKYSNLLAIYKPDYPMMRSLKNQMKALARRINAQKINIERSAAAKYNADVVREQAEKAEFEKEKRGFLGYQKKNIGFLVLKRTVVANKQVYNSLLQRLNEVSVAATKTATNIQILDTAPLPKAPYNPKTVLNILLASVFGLVGGVGLAFFMEYFDNTFKDTHEVERSVRLPTLGMIPLQKLAEGHPSVRRPLIAYSMNRSPVAEAFRSIGTFILLSSSAKPPKTILVTSPGEKEGKTTICINTAMALAESLPRGIIIDADLRKPKLHHSMEAVNTVGLSTFLSGNIGFEEGLIKQTKIKGLDIITSGPLAPNPSELIVSRRMKELLEALSGTYDFVIIDSAPVMGMPDSVYLSSIVDGSVLVIRAGQTTRNVLSETKKIFRSIDARILGVVLNGIKESDLRYNYYSNYYSSYFKEG